MKRRKIIAYLAISADGYIARPDGSVDWLDRPRPRGNYGMGAFVRSVDTILLGRKTYEQALALGWSGESDDSGFGRIKHLVFSSHPPAVDPRGVEFVRQPVKEFVQRLRATPGKDIWMMGGGSLIGSFLDAGEMDEFSIHVIPTFIGEGIPLVAPRHRDVVLKLSSVRKFADGVVHLHYLVPMQGRSRRRP